MSILSEAEQKAINLLFALLKEHEQMITNGEYFSKSNPTKQTYYGMLNKTIELLTNEYARQMQNENKNTL
jgi:hypothetical protein